MKRCTSCGSDVKYDPKNHALHCSSCSSLMNIDYCIYKGVKKDYFSVDTQNNMVYTCECEGCGNSLSFDKSSISFVCPYCGKSVILDNFKYDINAILPFTFGHDQLVEYYKSWSSRKWLAPSAFKKVSFVENFRGHFIPSYVFDIDAYSHYNGVYAITRTKTTGSGKNRRTTTYTEYRPFSGKRNDPIRNNMVIGCNFISNARFDELEPYDYSKLENYNQDFLQGYIVDNYSLDLNQGFKLTKEEVDDFIDREIRWNAPHRVHRLTVNTSYNDPRFARYLLPMYSGESNYKGKTYKFYVNGQTGKVSGDAPISPIKVTILVILITLFVLGIAILMFRN